jgi:DNA-binding FrmR family transcriptional regulator
MTEASRPHTTHPEIVKRLRRAEGHLRSIVEMIETGRPCPEIAQQMQAVENALRQAKKTLIHDHLNHCLENALGEVSRSQRRALDDAKDIAKYL